MKSYTFEIVIEKKEEDPAAGYFAYSPTLPGCFSHGQTIEEARRSIREAIQQQVTTLLGHGEEIPQNERLVHTEQLTLVAP